MPVITANTVMGAGSLASANMGAIMVESFAKILQIPMAVPAKMVGKSCALAR